MSIDLIKVVKLFRRLNQIHTCLLRSRWCTLILCGGQKWSCDLACSVKCAEKLCWSEIKSTIIVVLRLIAIIVVALVIATGGGRYIVLARVLIIVVRLLIIASLVLWDGAWLLVLKMLTYILSHCLGT